MHTQWRTERGEGRPRIEIGHQIRLQEFLKSKIIYKLENFLVLP